MELVHSNGHVRHWQQRLKKQSTRRLVIRWGLVAVNVLVLFVVALIVIHWNSDSTSSPAAANLGTSQPTTASLDQLTSADIAASLSSLANLPEATAIRNQAETVSAQLAVPPAESTIAAEPQVVATALKSREDIKTYIVQPGDTVGSLAVKFNVTSNSIKWSNDLVTDTPPVGTKLTIPPVNGIVYTVKSGDTPASLAQKYSSNAQLIIEFNDAELTGLTPGEQIVIPNGQQPAAPVYSFVASYGFNGYDYGFCTWYVANQVAVPDNWGNASSWAYYARLSGWNVSQTPTIGSIAQTPYAAGGQGHVAIVDGVSADGSEIEYKDMNGLAGWGRIGQSTWVPASTFQNYISH